MGLGFSTASNTASAVASAYTNVANNTNVLQDQSVVQAQSVTLENCDIQSNKNNNIKMSTKLTQSMTQIANVTNDATIANSISQALAQAATASVGAGVIGIADANNTASTYANMSTNVSNYVKFSSKQSSHANQSFTCQNSTIVSDKGGFNLSMQEMGDVTQHQKDSVMNQTSVTNTITQTIKQTATASTGMSWWVVLAIAIVMIVGGIIFKLKDAKSKATRAIDMQQAIDLGCCTNAQLNISNLSGGGPGNSRNQACAGCDCYKLAHPEAHISKPTVVIYFVGMLLIAGLIGIWYAVAMGRGCLFDDACGSNGGSNFNGMMAGCSCQFETTGDGDKVCQDSLHASFSSNGLPLKYQYPLFVENQSANGCLSDGTYGSSSMQGILVQAIATISPTSNSNNGKNMDTINNYFCFFEAPEVLGYIGQNCANSGTSSKSTLQYMYIAAVQYLDKQTGTDAYAILQAAAKLDPTPTIKSTRLKDDQTDDLIKRAAQLYAFMCPLRPVVFQACDKTPTTVTGTWPNVMTKDDPNTHPLMPGNLDWVTLADVNKPGMNVVAIPSAFRYGAGASISGDADAGCCSLHSMKYISPSDKTTDYNQMPYTCECVDKRPNSKASDDLSDAMSFCSGGIGRCANNKCVGGTNAGGTCSTYADCPSSLNGVAIYTNTQETAIALPTCSSTLVDKCADAYVPIQTVMNEKDTKNKWLTYYAEWTFFSANIADNDDGHSLLSLMRLLWAGTLSYIKGVSSDTIYGTNAALLGLDGANLVDHYYVQNVKGGQDWGAIGDTNTGSTSQVDDPSLLKIQLVESEGYDMLRGSVQAGCQTNAIAISGQGYKAHADSLGYCRSKFFNRITLYTIIGLLVFWTLTLPMFIIIRWYINKGTSSRYLAAANAQGNRKRQRTSIAQKNTNTQSPVQESSPTKESSPVQSENGSMEDDETPDFLKESPANANEDQEGTEMAGASDKMRRAAQNMRLNDEDRAQAQEQEAQEAQEAQEEAPAPEPAPEPEPEAKPESGDSGVVTDPFGNPVDRLFGGGKSKKKRLRFRR